jgi:hypothetical protein
MDGQIGGKIVNPLRRQKLTSLVAVFLLVGILAIAGSMAPFTMATDQPPAESRGDSSAPSSDYKDFAKKYLPSWPAGRIPELVLLFTGQQHNYEAPCGCTEPQAGGLERRYNFFAQIRGFGIATVAMDLGDIYSTSAISHLKSQTTMKYRLAMKALTLMQYDVVNVGPEEFRIPLDDALNSTVLNYKDCPYTVLCASIIDDKKTDFPTGDARGSTLEDFRVVQPKSSKIKVGVVGALGPLEINDLQKNKVNTIRFGKEGSVLPINLAAMKSQTPDVRVLLYQGTKEEAEKVAQSIDEFDIIQYRTDESDPPGQAARAKAAAGKNQPKSQLVTVGHKGRWIGVMGVFRNEDKSLDMRWQVVLLNPDFRTPAGKREEHPIVKLLEDYTARLRNGDFLARYERHLHPVQVAFTNQGKTVQPTYLGSEACKKCHAKEYEIWSESRHAGAYQTLFENPKAFPPHNRQFDGECVVCHTVGFQYPTGFRDSASGYTDETKSKHLFGMGCENCHGPGSMHFKHPENAEFKKMMSPWKDKPNDHLTQRAIATDSASDDDEKKKAVPEAERKVSQRVFMTCIKCHDTDNDHDFSHEKRWAKIAHGPTAKEK